MTEFKVTPVQGISPMIIDHCNYKITILMNQGVTVKFFRLHNNRWYKLKILHMVFLNWMNVLRGPRIALTTILLDGLRINCANKLL